MDGLGEQVSSAGVSNTPWDVTGITLYAWERKSQAVAVVLEMYPRCLPMWAKL